MIVEKKQPKAIDLFINELQFHLEKGLCQLWEGLTIFDRAYRVPTKDGFRVVTYEGDSEYDPLMESERDKVFFFVDDRKEHVGGMIFEADTYIVVMLDLEKHYTEISHRADEEAHVDFLRVLKRAVRGDRITEFITGIEEVKRTIRGVMKGAVNVGDVHPYHIFMVKVIARYNLDC